MTKNERKKEENKSFTSVPIVWGMGINVKL